MKIPEFDKIKNLLMAQCSTSLGIDTVARLEPVRDFDLAKKRQRETDDAAAVLGCEGSVPLGGITDIRDTVKRASLGSVLSGKELFSVYETLSAVTRLRSFLLKLRFKYILLGELGEELMSFPHIERSIETSVGEGGEVLDGASVALSSIRRELRTVQARITEKLSSIIASERYKTMIQDPVVTIRADRYCVPIKSDYKGQFPGIVHGMSASGATLFVEPRSIVEMGNARREAVVREQNEVEKILARLSETVGEKSDEIVASVVVCGIIDSVVARARLASAQNATSPILNDRGVIDLKQARHPLIAGDVVPIDVRLGRDFDAILITGPNTGGKTVTLKTIGLFAAMAACGMYIPAAPNSEMAVFDSIFVDIGDEQSIEQSLSTFSSHMKNIVEMTKRAGRNSLVLIDEIGAGTDPAEGAALAKAVLEYLLRKGAKIVATTHYGELKEYAYRAEGIENASVEFDPISLRPTYKLQIGIPGASNAFAIAKRLGLDAGIIAGAKAFLGTRADATDDMIRKLEASHREAERYRKEAEESAREAEEIKRRYEVQLTKLTTSRERIEEKARERARVIIDTYSKKLDDTIEQLATQRKDSQRAQALKKKAEKTLDDFAHQSKPKPKPEPKETKFVSEKELTIGTRVKIPGINQTGEVASEPKGGKVMVQIGIMKIEARIRDLRRAEDEAAPVSDLSASLRRISYEKAHDFESEIHLRKMRVEPALYDLDKFMDDAMAAQVESVRIVHGKGTGVMKQAVWQYLRNHPGVKSYRLGGDGEGGGGVTVVTMKR